MTTNPQPWHYNFYTRDIPLDYTHLYGLRIMLREDSPTVQGIQRVLDDLYEQRLLKPDYLLMAEQDITEMSKKFLEENEEMSRLRYIAGYFAQDDTVPYYTIPYWRDTVKRIFYGAGTTRIAPLPGLDHRVVIAGFFER